MNDEHPAKAGTGLDRLDYVSRAAVMLVIVIFTVMAFYIGLGLGSLIGLLY